MSEELNLSPGWLRADIERAVARTEEWKNRVRTSEKDHRMTAKPKLKVGDTHTLARLTAERDEARAEIERLREALLKCLPLLSRAHDRIHVLPRTTDGELAKDIDVMLGSIRAALGEGWGGLT